MVMIRSFYISLLDNIERILLDARGLAIHKKRNMKSGTILSQFLNLSKLSPFKLILLTTKFLYDRFKYKTL